MALTTEQLEQRKTYVGASDVASVMGRNPYKTVAEVWRLKRGIDDPWEGNVKTRIGQALESGIIELLSGEIGEVIKNVDDVDFTDPNRPYFVAHLDGLITRDDGTVIAAEAKSTNGFSWKKWQEEKYGVPEYYWCQVQAQMYLAEASRAVFGVLIDNSDFQVVWVERDDAFINEMIESVDWFWKCVEDGIQPEVDPSHPSEIARVSELPNDDIVVELDDDILAKQLTVKEKKSEVSKLNKEIKALEADIKGAVGNAKRATFSDGSWIERKHFASSEVSYVRKAYSTLSYKKPKKK